MLVVTPWTVGLSSSDPDTYSVVGAYLVADGLPIEDANIIAAAPDLYAALERIVASVSSGPSGEVCQTGNFEVAKKALAKARGEST